MLHPPERLLSTADVARRFDVTPSTVSRWVKRGRLAAIKTPGGTLRFRRADIDALLDTVAEQESA